MPSGVVVIGASAGIGREIAREFARLGADVLMIARNGARLETAAASIRDEFAVRIVTQAIDAFSPDAAAAVARAMVESGIAFGTLIVTVGAWTDKPVSALTPAELRATLDGNIAVPVSLCRALLPQLAGRPRRVLLTGSLAGAFPMPWLSGYGAAKAGMHAAVKAMRQELAHSGVSVSLLAPGAVLTGFVPRGADPGLRWVVDLIASTPETVARAAVRGVLTDTPFIVPGIAWRLMWLGSYLVPAGLLALLMRAILAPSTWGSQASDAGQSS